MAHLWVKAIVKAPSGQPPTLQVQYRACEGGGGGLGM